MPHNKSETIRKQQNQDTILEEAVTLKPDKAKDRPSSLNGIDKNSAT
jgi:hypothetical protein